MQVFTSAVLEETVEASSNGPDGRVAPTDYGKLPMPVGANCQRAPHAPVVRMATVAAAGTDEMAVSCLVEGVWLGDYGVSVCGPAQAIIGFRFPQRETLPQGRQAEQS